MTQPFISPTATYRRLKDGAWGREVQGAFEIGERVTATTRGGTTKIETTAAVVRRGDGKALTRIGPRALAALITQHDMLERRGQ